MAEKITVPITDVAAHKGDDGMVPAIVKAVRIIDYIERHDQGASFSSISENLNIPGSSAYRILKTLVKFDFLSQDESDRFVLGTRFLTLAHSVAKRLNLVILALPFLEEFERKTNETCKLVVKQENTSVCLVKAESNKELRVTLSVGATFPLHIGAASKLILAHCSEEEINRILSGELPAYTQNTVTDADKLRSDLRSIVLRGYAEDNEEYRVGVKGLACPVFDFNDQMVAAVSCPYLASEIDASRRKELLMQLSHCAREISEALGSACSHP